MASSQTEDSCGICGNKILGQNDNGYLHKAGAATIIKISEDLGDGLAEKIESMSFPITVHASCRKTYTKSFNSGF